MVWCETKTEPCSLKPGQEQPSSYLWPHVMLGHSLYFPIGEKGDISHSLWLLSVYFKTYKTSPSGQTSSHLIERCLKRPYIRRTHWTFVLLYSMLKSIFLSGYFTFCNQQVLWLVLFITQRRLAILLSPYAVLGCFCRSVSVWVRNSSI